jgi:hypothetical protein
MSNKLRILGAGLAAITMVGLTASPGAARPTWDTTPVNVTRDVKPTPHIVNLRVGEHPTYDRVVIDMSGPIPGYQVRYVTALHYDGSGDSVPLKGSRFIAIRLTPAVAHDAQGNSVYVGPTLVQYAMPTLRGVAFTGDYESNVSFGLALSHRDTFRVLEVHAPNRLVIDVHH